jgi:hypothetical protein
MPTSACGNIGFVGRTTGATSVDAFYAGCGGQVVSANPVSPRGWFYISTADDPAYNAGNTPRLYVGEGVFLSSATGQSSGNDLGPRTLNADTIGADRVFAGARSGGLPAGTYHSLSGDQATAEGEEILRVGFKSGTYSSGLRVFTAISDGSAATQTVARFTRYAANNRSINADGTVNTSGADYAEYMYKRPDCGALEKGAICGVDADGLLTDQWSLAHSFAIKSTDPAYVGGDTWCVDPDLTEEEIEERRQQVDRVAFSGQVPVNVTGASPGQFIVPVQGPGGTITGQASATNPGTAVGRVWKVLGDGRAWVKVL